MTSKDVFVYDVMPASEEVVIGGLAVDIGTTTVSAILLNMATGEILAKASSGNGQIRYGADVINRIIESQKPGGGRRLQKAVIEETINPLIQQMCHSCHFGQGPHISDVCGFKYDHESPADGSGCRSYPKRALYSYLF